MEIRTSSLAIEHGDGRSAFPSEREMFSKRTSPKRASRSKRTTQKAKRKTLLTMFSNLRHRNRPERRYGYGVYTDGLARSGAFWQVGHVRHVSIVAHLLIPEMESHKWRVNVRTKETFLCISK